MVEREWIESTDYMPSGAKLRSSVPVVSANVRSTESYSVDVLLHDLSNGVGHVLDGTEVLQPSASSVDVSIKVGLSDGSRSRHNKSSVVASSVVGRDHVLVGNQSLLG